MNESWVRFYMDRVGVEDSENFLVRPMELGVWPLDDQKFLKSGEGRLVVIDTSGYFNPAEDTSAYQQSIAFAELVFNVLQAGAEAVIGLCHPPKYASQNLNPDLNDPKIWLYVQGMKNPGLKPFQLEGPAPLRLKVPPGESPYLPEVLRQSARRDPQETLLRECSVDKVWHSIALFTNGGFDRRCSASRPHRHFCEWRPNF